MNYDRMMVGLLMTAEACAHYEGLPTLPIESQALRELPEYSCSIPTGVTAGKRWKRDSMWHAKRRLGPGEPMWVVCEFYEIPGRDDYMGIRYFRPVPPTHVDHLRA